MKREKGSDILAEVCTEANIRQSVIAVLRGSKRKRTREGRRIIENIDRITTRLIREISTGTFMVSGFTEMHIVEGGKPRTVQSVPLYDRIGVHAIMSVIESHVKRRYIHTTAASIKGRGVHFLLRRIVDDLAADPEGMRYIYESDVKNSMKVFARASCFTRSGGCLRVKFCSLCWSVSSASCRRGLA